jgi:Protein of unknown function (DUF3159)
VTQPPDEHPPSPLEMLRDPRAVIDSTVPGVAFVIVYAITSEVNPSAAVAVGIGLLIFIERLIRRKPVVSAVGGLFGVALAAFIAVRSGKAEGFFVPKMAYQFALGVVFAGSAAIRRPLTGYIIAQIYRAEPGWADLRPVRRVMIEYTLAWALLFTLRGCVFAVLIAGGRVGSLAVASVAMGLPAFGLLLLLGFLYVPRRLEQLGAPNPRSDA